MISKKVGTGINFIIFVTSLLIFVGYGCSNKGYRQITSAEVLRFNIFSEDFEKALYQSTYDIYNHNLTGITIIKKTDSSFRVVSMSEIGMKYFDFEFPINNNSAPIKHYIIEPVDKKLLVSMFFKDFGYLFKPMVNEFSIRNTNEPDKIEIRDNRINYIANNDYVQEISKSRFILKDKSIVKLGSKNSSSPDSIIFNHGKIVYQLIKISSNN